MGTMASMRPIQWVLMALLCLSLLGCGLINPRPPKAVVEGAIAQKLSQTQAVLYRHFAAAPTDRTQVGRIHVTDHHWTELSGQPTIEVIGTYHLKGGSLTNAQRGQTREFDVYLQRGATKDQWLLLEPVNVQGGEIPKWQAIPLLTTREDEPGNPG